MNFFSKEEGAKESGVEGDKEKDEGGPSKPPPDTRTEAEKEADVARVEASNKAKADAFASRVTPPEGKRKFSMIIQNIQITNDDEKHPHDIYLKFVLGRTRKTVTKNGKKSTVGKKGKVMRTETWKKLKANKLVESNKILKANWVGEYSDLDVEELKIEVWDWDRWTPDDLMCTKIMKLVDVAKQSVFQVVEFKLVDEDGQESPYCTLRAEILFSEVFPFELNFEDWRGMELKAADYAFLGGSPSSDPYIKFRIPAPRYPFKRGFRFGRTTKTSVQRNTLFPVWGDCKKPLYYTGTRSELENEMLLIDVYDWDFGSKDDIIGQAFIPLTGVLDVGFLQVGLALEENDPDIKKKKVLNDYGQVQGYIKAKQLPVYSQIGQPIILKEGITYLAIKIEKAEQLRAADPSGTSDPLFVVEWDGSRNQTPIQVKTLNPVFESTLYFAVKAQKITEGLMSKKGPVKLTCYDWDESGSFDILGKCELGLDKITSSFPAPKEATETRGRMYQGTVPLIVPGMKLESTVTLKAWFEPDLPLEIKIAAAEKTKAKELPKKFKERHKEWKLDFPKRADPSRLAQYSIAQTDEENVTHFLCEYVAPFNLPPEEMFPVQPVTPNVLARMVRSITFASDEECFGIPDREIWVNPNFFLDMKKGDADAHAVLLCNLFLGLQLDAYVCIGRMKNVPGLHTWVMTREPDGTVQFWETMKGRPVPLPRRWKGMFMDDILFAENQKLEEQKGKEKTEEKAKRKRKKVLSEDEIKEQQRKELEMMFLDEDEVFGEELLEHDAIGDPEKRLANEEQVQVEEAEDEEEEEENALVIPEMPGVQLPYESVEVVFNQENIWANIQYPNPARIRYDFENPLYWSPFIHGWKLDEPVKPFFDIRPSIGPPLSEDRCAAMASDIKKEFEEYIKSERQDKGMQTEWEKKMVPVLEMGLWKLEVSYAKWTDASKRDFDGWKGRLVAACPGGYRFEGIPVTFSYTDPKKIRKFVIERYPFHEDSTDGIKFALAVKVFAYPMTTVSIWVYLAKLEPVGSKKK